VVQKAALVRKYVLDRASVVREMVEALVLQFLEHEVGGIRVYQTALKCAVHPGLKKEWKNTSTRRADT
jgi:hypothetical protein